MYTIEDIDVNHLRRDYTKQPLKEGEYITKEEFEYLYLYVNLSFEEIDTYLGSAPGTAKNKNRRKPGAVKSDKFGFVKNKKLQSAKMREVNFQKTGYVGAFENKEILAKSIECHREKLKDEEFKNSVVNKLKTTLLERYGVDNPLLLEGALEKSKKTRLERYGNFNNSDKIKQTKLERYGDSSYLNREQIFKTNLERYGSISALGNSEIQAKKRATMKERYNAENTFQVEEFKIKCLMKRRRKYGVNYIGQKNIEHYEDYTHEYVREHFIKDNYFMLEDALDYFKVNQSSMDAFKKRHNINEPNKHTKHIMQNEIYDYIKSIYDGDVICDTRKVIEPLELDIYIPDKKIAIEFDGLYYHSVGSIAEDGNRLTKRDELSKGMNNYHKLKTDLCEEKGIKLFHIFENEWVDEVKKEIWKSMISNALGLSKRISAGSCKFSEISFKEAKEFLHNNHMQQECNSSINYGLYYKGELVSVMTFSHTRFVKGCDWELLRFCNKKGYTVRFAATRLLQHFRKEHEGVIVSYANRRWSNGSLYEYLGFTEKEEVIKPNYFYFEPNSYELLNRINFQKHKLRKLLEVYDDKLSESANMFNNGFRKIYDSGNKTYIFK